MLIDSFTFTIPTNFVGNLGVEFIPTNNNGACCASDNVNHECCIYSDAYDPNFTVSQCATLCLNDGECKGYSTHSTTQTLPVPPGAPPTPIVVEFCLGLLPC